MYKYVIRLQELLLSYQKNIKTGECFTHFSGDL